MNLQFVRKILDISELDILIDNLQNGVLKLNGNSYSISSEERNFLTMDFDISDLYGKHAHPFMQRKVD
jgi:hypothetical protein